MNDTENADNGIRFNPDASLAWVGGTQVFSGTTKYKELTEDEVEAQYSNVPDWVKQFAGEA